MSDSDSKVQELQMMEQNLQGFLAQKQNLQMQQMETSSALEELSKSEKAYKIVGNIMVSADKNSLKEELEKKNEIIDLRIKTIEKQEEKIRENAKKLQKEVVGDLQQKKKNR